MISLMTALGRLIFAVLTLSILGSALDAVPKRYNVTVNISSDGSKFTGTAEMDVYINKQTKDIELNTRGLHILSLTTYLVFNSRRYSLKTIETLKNEKYQISIADQEWEAESDFVIMVNYEGNISHSLSGIYKSTCPDGSVFLTGLDQMMTVFPSFEEPPAPVAITINRSSMSPQKYSGNSTDVIGWMDGNIVIRRQEGSVLSPCSRTPPLRTDLLDAAADILDGLNISSYNIYLHPDLYMPYYTITNASIIREEYMVDDDMSNWENDTARSIILRSVIRQRLKKIGNNSEWLVAGLSYYFGHKALAKAFGESASLALRRMELERSLQSHSLKKTMPLQPDEIPEERYNYIDDCKAGTILKMLEETIGLNNFTRIIGSLLDDSSETPASKLLTLLGDKKIVHISNTNLPEMLSKWIEMPGYPVITASITDGVLRLSQKPFNSDHSQKWVIPVFLWAKKENGMVSKLGPYWLMRSDITVPLPKDTVSISFNNDASGYYRVMMTDQKYGLGDESVWRIADSLSLAAVKKMKYSDAMRGTQFLPLSSMNAWSLAIPQFSKISASLSKADDKILFQNYLIGLMDTFSSRTGNISKTNYLSYNSTSSNVTSSVGNTSSQIIPGNSTGMNTVNDGPMIVSVSNMSNSTMSENSSVIPVLESFCSNGYMCLELYTRYSHRALNITTSNLTNSSMGALCASSQRDAKLWDAVYMSMISRDPGLLKNKLLHALACSANSTQVSWLLDSFLVVDSKLARQDFVKTISAMITSEDRARLVFNWMTKNWANVSTYLPGNKEVMRDIITSISYFVFDKNFMREVENFFKPRAKGFAVGRALERMEMNCWMREEISPAIKEWLISDKSGSPKIQMATSFFFIIPLILIHL